MSDQPDPARATARPSPPTETPRLSWPTTVVRDSYLAGERAGGLANGTPLDWLERAADGFPGFVRERRGVHTRWGVPCTVFWYVAGREYLGMLVVRHRLTPELSRIGGHIGYHVVLPWRRQGHANRMLAAGLAECRALGLDRVLLTCDAGNDPSRRVILANGGVPDGRFGHEDRFWITLSPAPFSHTKTNSPLQDHQPLQSLQLGRTLMTHVPPDAPGAILVRAADAEQINDPTRTIRLLTDSPATGGILSTQRVTLFNGTDGAYPHHHAKSGEMFYVLGGTVQLLTGDHVAAAHEGDLAFVPPGLTHAFAAARGADADLLIVITPGVERFEYFRHLARIVKGEATPESLLKVQERYDTWFGSSPAWDQARQGLTDG